MVYLFFNILMYFVINMIMVFIIKNKFNVYSFIILLFHLNLSFFFIYQDINFIYFLIFTLISIFIYKILFYYSNDDKEIILIKEGNINFHNLIKYYSYNKLLKYLKIRNIRLDEISYCLLKNNRIVIVKDEIIKNFPVSIIINGVIREENLHMIKKNINWLNSELEKENINLKNIDYAYYIKDKIYFIKSGI